MNNIYFIDSNTPDIETLIAGFPINATSVILQADKNGLEQIAAYLQTNDVKNLDAIHLFSHGSTGELYLGNSNVTADTLNQNADLLKTIGQSLSTTGDILLYGCDVAQGEIGQNFVDTLANLTGADVAASNDLTGAADLGGDWDLEVHSGEIDAESIFVVDYHETMMMGSTYYFTGATFTSAATDSGISSSDFITNASTLTFGGTYTASTTSSSPYTLTSLAIYDNTTKLKSTSGSATSGSWSMAYTTALSEGTHTLTLRDGSTSTTGNLYATKTLIIDRTAPTLTTLAVQTPATGTQVVYRATFSEAIAGLTASNFSASGSTANSITSTPVGTAVNGGYTAYDISVYGGNFSAYSGNEILSFANATGVTDVAGNAFVKPATTATAVVNNAVATPVTLTNFSAITGGNEDTEQTVTFSDLITAGDETSTAGAVDTFIVSAVSTGTLKIGATSATATAWVSGTNDVVDATHSVYWTPAANANGTLNAFTAIAKEVGGQTSPYPVQATVSVTAVNDAPVLDASKSPAFTGTYNGGVPTGAVGALVSSLVDFATPSGQVDNVTDVDTGALLGIAITATDTNGTWYYSTNAGSTWNTVGAVSETSALLLAADANTRIYLQPTSGFIGSANFTIKAWDQTSGTAGTKGDTSAGAAFSSATDTVAANIIPSGTNVIYTDTSAADTFTDWTGTLVGTGTDTITGGSTGSWTVSGTTYTDQKVGTYGTLYVKDGSAGMSMMASATAGTYRYVPNATAVNALSNGTITETYTITDSTSETINIYIQGTNDAPVLDATKSPILAGQVGNASTPTAPTGIVGTLVSDLVDFSNVVGGFDNVSDVDIGASLGIALTAVDATNGSWYFSTDGGSTWNTVNSVSTTNALLLAAGANTRLYFSPNQDYFGTVANAITFKAWDTTSGTAGTYLTTATGSQFSTATDTASIKISNPSNHAPTFTSSAATVSYIDTAATDTFTNQTGTLTASDVDGNSVTFSILSGILSSTTINSVVYDVSSASTYGTLYVKSSTGDYVFVPTSTAIDALSAATTATFTVLADDGQTTTPQTLTLNLSGANDTPILDASKSPAFAGTYNGSAPTGAVGALVSSLVSSSNVTDVDTGAVYGLAITATDSTNGTWYYSTNAGSTWNAVGAVSETSALLLAADANTRVYLQPTTGFIGSANLTIRAWDTTSGSNGFTNVDTTSGMAFSSATDTVAVTVAPTGIYEIYADTAALNTFTYSTPTSSAGWTGTLIATGADTISGGVSSNGTSPTGFAYTDYKTGSYGTLYVKDGGATGPSGSAGTYRYEPNNNAINALSSGSSGTDSFSVTSGGGMMNPGSTDTLNVYVTGANDTPVLTTLASTTFTDTVAFNSFYNRTGTLTATDAEGSTITYGISGGIVSGTTSTLVDTYGTLTLDTASGAYTFTPNDMAINALSSTQSHSLTFTASDGNLTGTTDLVLDLRGVNDTPILATPTAISLTDTAATDTFVVQTGTLSATDADTGTTLTYGVSGGTVSGSTTTKVGTYGTLVITTSTGAYTYTPNATAINAISANQTDTFTVTASDGNLSGTNSLTVNLTGTNDTPILVTPTAISLVDTAAADTFVVQTGNLSATDAETTSLIYGISGTDTVTSNGVVTKIGIYGTLAITTATGAYTYTPNNTKINALASGSNPTDTFTVTASDGSLSDSKTLMVNLIGANDTPILATQITPITLTDTVAVDTFSNQTGTIGATDAEGTALNYGLSGSSATSFNDNSISYDLKTAGTYGDFYVKSSTGEYVYVPDNTKINAISANQSETFTVTIVDGDFSGSNTVTVNLTGTNDAPILVTPTAISLVDTAAADMFSVQTGTLSATDAENSTINYGIFGETEKSGFVTQVGTYGTLKIKTSDGSYTYTPNDTKINALALGSNPSETFTVMASDGSVSDSKIFTVNLTGATDTPVFATPNSINLIDTAALDDFGSPTNQLIFTADEGTTLKYGIAGVVTASNVVTQTSDYGDLVLDTSSGLYSFIANNAVINALSASSTHTVNFDVTASYGGTTYPKTLAINVTGANDSPILDATKNPGLVEQVADLSAPTGEVGVLVSDFVNSSNVSDVDTGAKLGVALTSVGNTNGSWFYSTDNGATWTTVGIVSDATPLLLDTNNRLYFQPTSLSTTVSDEITFKAWDEEANSQFSIATDSITVLLNQKPVFSSVAITLNFTDTAAKDTFENSTGTLTATDANHDSLTYGVLGGTVSSGVSTLSTDYGSLVVNTISGAYTFTPNATAINALKANATSTFTITVSDGHGTPATQDLTLNLTGTNDTPLKTGTIANLSSGTQGAVYSISTSDLVQGYTDADGDTLSVSNLVADNGGTIAAAGNNWTFTPTSNFGGTVNLTYDVVDGHGGNVVGVNQRFSLIIIANAQGAQIDTPFSYNASAIFSGTGSYSATLENGDALPSWLNINTSTGLLGGTPTLSDLGSETISITKNGTIKNVSLVIEPFKMGSIQISSNSSSNNTITGGAGIDTVSYYYSSEPVTVTLPNTNTGTGKLVKIDNLIGSQKDDSLTGNKFANTLDGGAGTDTLAGGLGNDVYIIRDISDVIVEAAGTGTGMDTVFTAVDSYPLPANVENLTLLGSDNLTAIGNALSNTIIGNSGNNTIISNGGGDWLKGGKGNDTYILDYTKQSNITITENAKEGTDSVEVNGTYVLPKYVENLTLTGTKNINGTGNDDGNNIVIGNDGNNKLYGLKGNDTLDGGLGNDTLTGGAGADQFKFSSLLDATNNVDTIADFVSGTDKIALSQTIFKALTVGNLPSNEMENHILYDKTTGILSYDEDGSIGIGVAVQIALLGVGTKHPALLNTDFTVV